MTDPPPQDHQYQQYPPYPPGGTATFYAPPESLYQNPPYDYESQQLYAQQYPQNQDVVVPYDTPHNGDPSIPRTVVTGPPAQQQQQQPQTYLSPDSAANIPHPGSGSHQGSNAEYYNPTQEGLPSPGARSSPHPRAPDGAHGDETDRGVGSALVGGATGYYLGHKQDHGLLGAVGGAILGNYLGDKMKDDISSSSGEESDRRRRHGHRHHRHHGHGHHHHHHHHHRHHLDHEHRHRHHRSRSRHNYQSDSS